MADKTCGECSFGHSALHQGKIDLTKRICYGNPPIPVVVSQPGGQQITGVRPTVASTDAACSLYKSKLISA